MISLNQSNGGIGRRLNIAKEIFINEKVNQKEKNMSLTQRIACNQAPLIFELINKINIQETANTRLVAGHARATISSPLRVFL
ncbi:TPA: hypothetical protein DEP21_04760 [Patescibacteria group bacterium]|nr:hypothetical protein [Candidatus Gracilibacteria bacterium]